MTRALRIAIDASRTTVTQRTGTEYYATRLIQGLLALDTAHTFTLYFRDAPPPGLFPDSPRVRQRVLPLRRAWTHAAFAAALWGAHLRGERPDVTFVPAHTLPFAFPGRAVVTVHDLGYKHFPDAHPSAARRYLDWTTRFSAGRATLVLADSRATADDLHRFYRVNPAKIRILYPGVDPLPIADMPDILRVRAKYGLPERYFLFIGTLQPRKNVERLVLAYRRYRAMYGAILPGEPEELAGLVLAGAKGWLYDPAWTDGVDGVVAPGYVDEADKGALYAGATALVFPSLHEGFGFPVIEAMSCGTPVLTSNTSSLPELVGSAALTFDPTNADVFARAMGVLSWDEELRRKLRMRGIQQAAQFTWARAAAQAMGALELAAQGG